MFPLHLDTVISRGSAGLPRDLPASSQHNRLKVQEAVRGQDTELPEETSFPMTYIDSAYQRKVSADGRSLLDKKPKRHENKHVLQSDPSLRDIFSPIPTNFFQMSTYSYLKDQSLVAAMIFLWYTFQYAVLCSVQRTKT